MELILNEVNSTGWNDLIVSELKENEPSDVSKGFSNCRYVDGQVPVEVDGEAEIEKVQTAFPKKQGSHFALNEPTEAADEGRHFPFVFVYCAREHLPFQPVG